LIDASLSVLTGGSIATI